MQQQQGWVYAWQAAEPNDDAADADSSDDDDDDDDNVARCGRRRTPPPPVRNEMWLNYPLMFEDTPIGLNALACPQTLALLQQVGGIHAAGFSWMKAGCRIAPHFDTTGAQFGNLALHVGLQVPDGNQCVLRVNGLDAVEEDGKLIIFDATHTHSAYNASDSDRIILYVDFEMDTSTKSEEES
eukprot:TRINITY_DN354_c0_g5_i1.p1 TRINITY_DN354_c0_g5~~TRINITY_DN354_c0_g5_i1.p1  ORF type:complete len:183 (+),score=54.53 TRINITY_DN354_c0_g5_i1:262-810(+)